MSSLDDFAEVEPGTRFIWKYVPEDEPAHKRHLRTVMFLKLAPNGNDIGNCNLVNLETGEIVHACELWDMHQEKLDDNPYADPENVVQHYEWELAKAYQLAPDTLLPGNSGMRIRNIEEVLDALGIDFPSYGDGTETVLPSDLSAEDGPCESSTYFVIYDSDDWNHLNEANRKFDETKEDELPE